MNNSINALPGETIYTFMLRAIEKAKKMNIYVSADFNDTKVFVHPESYVQDSIDKLILMQHYNRTKELS